MLDREKKLSADWAVFYHSYNSPALIYEVQAALASVLFHFQSQHGVLPRLLKAPFDGLPDAPSVLRAFPTWPDRDHSPAFKSVGICVSTSLLSKDPEAPPLACFLAGYAASVVDASVLKKLLTDCGAGLRGHDVSMLASEVIAMGRKHGLPQCTGRGSQGHLLQIFIRRALVDRYAYASLPLGVPDASRTPLGRHLEGPGPIVGQARLVPNPSAFMRARSVRLYTASAEPTFRRGAFQAELCGALAPVLGDATAREAAARGIYGGSLPGWWRDAAS